MNLSALTVQQLRYLVAVDDLRNFRDAAATCHVTQPALSSQVKKAEELLGSPIFDRSRQPIVPTEHGIKILAQVRRALEQFDRIGLVAKESDELSGHFRLGVIPTLASSILPLFVPDFVQRHPRVALEIIESKTEPMVRALREGTLDAGLAATPLGLSGVHEHSVCRETLYAYLPTGHRLCACDSIHQTDLLEEQLWLLADGHCFRNQVLSLCSVQRQSPLGGVGGMGGRVDIDVGSFETLVGFVDAGLGVTVVPELFIRRLSPAQRKEQVRAFHSPEPAREIGFLVTRKQLRRDIFSTLLRVAHETVPPELHTPERGPGPLHILPPSVAEPREKLADVVKIDRLREN